MPAHLARTITWDQGKEMACRAGFTIATSVPVYFCDPHKGWQTRVVMSRTLPNPDLVEQRAEVRRGLLAVPDPGGDQPNP